MKYFLIFFAVLLSVSAIHAYALLAYYTVEDLAKLSKYIIMGKVIDIKPTIPDEKAIQLDDLSVFLYDVSVKVENELKAQYTNDTIKFRIMNDRDIGSLSKSVEDSEKFEVGERVLVFLADKEPDSVFGDSYYVVGTVLGKYAITDGLAYGFEYPDGIDVSKLLDSFSYITNNSAEWNYFGSDNYSIYSLKHKQYKYFIPYKISNAYIEKMELNCETSSLLVYLQDSGDGSFTVNIPRKMLNSKGGHEDSNFIIILDREETPFEEIESNSESRTLDISFTMDSKVIEIIATQWSSDPSEYPPTCATVESGESQYYHLLTPLQQFKSGTPSQYVNCNDELELLIKASNGQPICVKPSTKAKLLYIKWAEPTRILG